MPIADVLKNTIHSQQIGPGTKVLQIGADAGNSGGDPVWPMVQGHKRWIFWRVEPRVELFDKLVRRHKDDDNVIVHQSCVIPDDQEEGVVKMWQITPDDELPKWTRNVASLDPAVPKYANDRREERQPEQPKATIEAVDVYGQHFSSLLAETHCIAPHVVVASMGGYENLAVVPSLQWRPLVICFEFVAMSRRGQLEATVAALQDADYEKTFHGGKEMVWVPAGAPDA